MIQKDQLLFRDRPRLRSYSDTDASLRIATLNVKNIKSNKVFVQQLLKTVDILCIQEHWLFNFELDLLNSISNTHRCCSKAVDDNDPVSPIGPPRGYGGVGIFYRKDWNLKILEIPSGRSRVSVIEICAINPLLVISVYLPSRKYVRKDSSTGDPSEFESILAQLAEIIQTYESSHNIVLCGDMNSSLRKRQGNDRDQMLSHFTKAMNLHSYQQGFPTFFHENGKDTSKIDYIFTKARNLIISKPTIVKEKNSLNLSDHTHLEIELKFDYETATPQNITIPVKPKWQTCNVQLYRKTVEEGLRESFRRNQTSDSIYDLHCQIRDLTNVMKDATEQSIPKYKSHIVKKANKTQHKWNSDIHLAIREC